MLLIGSKAIKHHFPDFHREPKDNDWAVEKEKKSTKEVEYLLNPILGKYEGVADPNTLYTLKISHVIGWDIKWDKHMFDIHFLRKKGCVLNKELFYELYNFWNDYHGKNRRSELNMSADKFFNNALKLKYDHDFIHTLLNPNPTYFKVLKDGAEVDVCENKFNMLTFEEKCNLVREEVQVMSWERWGSLDFRIAYCKMLKKFILDHAPIWEAIFIVENYPELLKYKVNHFKIIEDGLKQLSHVE